MGGKWKEVVRLAFKGPRFEDHALDLGALSELAQFQKMVARTAEALWRAANPNRKNLPAHFDERTRLCLRRIDPGSAVAPLEVLLVDEEPDQTSLLPEVAGPSEPKELRDAIEVAQEVFDAVESNAPLPDRLPRSLVPEYAKWGATLGSEESIEFNAPGRRPTAVTSTHRERFERLQDGPHESHVELTGEVLEADVRQKRFQLWIDERTSVSVTFSEEQESEVTTALKEHRDLKMRVKGTGEVAPTGEVLKITEVSELTIQPAGEVPPRRPHRPIEEVIAEIAAQVPAEEWAKLPRDLSKNHDHYLYGAPKKP